MYFFGPLSTTSQVPSSSITMGSRQTFKNSRELTPKKSRWIYMNTGEEKYVFGFGGELLLQLYKVITFSII